jgi:hypothetical protein
VFTRRDLYGLPADDIASWQQSRILVTPHDPRAALVSRVDRYSYEPTVNDAVDSCTPLVPLSERTLRSFTRPCQPPRYDSRVGLSSWASSTTRRSPTSSRASLRRSTNALIVPASPRTGASQSSCVPCKHTSQHAAMLTLDEFSRLSRRGSKVHGHPAGLYVVAASRRSGSDGRRQARE